MFRTLSRRFRPALEALEARWMPASFAWILRGDGDFNVPGNWRDQHNNPGVPGAGDDATIPGGIVVTSSTSNTVNTVNAGQLRVAAGTFAINNFGRDSSLPGLIVDQGATLQVKGGVSYVVGSEISGTLNVSTNATLRFLRGDNNLNAGVSLTGPGQYLVSGDVYGGPSISINTDVTAPARFHLQNGSLDGAGTLTVGGTFDWIQGGSGGTTMRGTGVTKVLAGATLKVGGSGVVLESRTIDNHGTVVMNTAHDFIFTGAATFINRAGALFDIVSDGDMPGGRTETFRNLGTVRKSAGLDDTNLWPTFENSATVDVQTGTLSLLTGRLSGGTYRTSANAVLDLTGAYESQLTGTFTAAGNGTVAIDNGTFTIANTGATITVPSTVSFRWSGGHVVVPIDTTLTYNGVLRLSGTSEATLRGGGTLTLVGEIVHTGSGAFRISPSSGNSTASTLNIPAGSIYTLATDADIYDGTGAVVKNAGLIRKTGGVGTSEIRTAFYNSGKVTVASGILALRSTGGRSTGGTFHVAAGAILDLTGGNYVEYAGVYTATGAGEVRMATGTLRAAGGSAGVTFNFPAGMFRWSGGSIDTGTVSINVSGGMTIEGDANKTLYGGGSLNLSGTLTHRDSGDLYLSNTSLRIAANGLYDLQSDADLYGNGTLVNAGTFRKSNGTSDTLVQTRLNNTGKVEVRSGVVSVRTVDQIFNGKLTGGTWSVVSNAMVESVLNLNANLTSIGPAANVSISGPNSTFESLANLSAIAGSFTLQDGQTLSTVGALTNSGKLTLAPGSSLNLNGNFTQTAFGTLTVQSNLAAGLAAGRITTTNGRAALAGKVVMSMLGATKPAVGAKMMLVDNTGAAAISGLFAGMAEGATVTFGGMKFRISYKGGTGNDVVLTRLS